MKVRQALNLEDIHRLAKRRLPQIVFDFVEGGADDELGLAHNQSALQRFKLTPRFGVDVSRRDQSTTVFGRTYASPFGIAPTGLTGLLRRDAELLFAEAAAAANIPFIISTGANASLEAAAKIAPDNLWFQLYATNTRAVGQDLVRRARDVGVATLVVSVDVPMRAKRERDWRNGFTYPPKMTPRALLESLAHPGWLFDFLRAGGTPAMQNFSAYSPDPSAGAIAAFFAGEMPSANQTWRDLEEIRRLWPGHMVIKGILHPADAVRTVQLGADGLYISNHGGRQLDRAPAPGEMAPLIRAAVGSGPTLFIDSGIRRGSDVLVARCLGAAIAFTGRPMAYGMAAGGLAGVRRVIDILRDEVDMTMGAIGCPSLADLRPDVLFDSHSGQFETRWPSRSGAPPTVECSTPP